MNLDLKNKKLLGINGLGRIGKLLLWNQIHLRNFDGIVINFGREVGKKLDDFIQVIESDSTYGSIHKFLFGMVAEIMNKLGYNFFINSFPIRSLLACAWATQPEVIVQR